MDNPIENLNERAKELENVTSGTNLALSEMRIQFETLAEMQKEERIETQKMHNEAVDKLMERHAKEVAHWKHIVIGLILVIALFVGGLIGTAVYIFSTYDFIGLDQIIDIGGDGSPIINDGIHCDRTD